MKQPIGIKAIYQDQIQKAKERGDARALICLKQRLNEINHLHNAHKYKNSSENLKTSSEN